MVKHTSKKLKISSLHRLADNKEVSQLRISGKWVEQLGFKIGERVNLLHETGC